MGTAPSDFGPLADVFIYLNLHTLPPFGGLPAPVEDTRHKAWYLEKIGRV